MTTRSHSWTTHLFIRNGSCWTSQCKLLKRMTLFGWSSCFI